MHRMRAERLGGLCFAAGFVLLWIWVGCGGASANKRDLHHPECVKDADCPSGFCDHMHCIYLEGPPCDEVPPVRSLRADRLSRQCGASLCIDGRCRSCRSNADCQSYFGAGECVNVVGAHFRPGPVCWPMGANPYEHDNVQSNIEICVHDPADAPGVKRLDAGKACLRDCDCMSAFCDRGACADSADLGAWNYGQGQCQPGPPHAPADNILTWPAWDMCGGYICVEGRCRSCQSDAECQEGSTEYRCLPLYGLPGKRCGRPSEAKRSPTSDRMRPPPLSRSAPPPPAAPASPGK
jgi:hypothetical protein